MTPPDPPNLDGIDVAPRCGRRCQEFYCDRERGHEGLHRAYRIDQDEVVFWGKEKRNHGVRPPASTRR
jgi:hypothetical protein